MFDKKKKSHPKSHNLISKNSPFQDLLYVIMWEPFRDVMGGVVNMFLRGLGGSEERQHTRVKLHVRLQCDGGASSRIVSVEVQM